MEVALSANVFSILTENPAVEFQDSKALGQSDSGFASVIEMVFKGLPLHKEKASEKSGNESMDGLCEDSGDIEDENFLYSQQPDAGLYAMAQTIPCILFNIPKAMVKDLCIKSISPQNKAASEIAVSDLNTENGIAGAAHGRQIKRPAIAAVFNEAKFEAVKPGNSVIMDASEFTAIENEEQPHIASDRNEIVEPKPNMDASGLVLPDNVSINREEGYEPVMPKNYALEVRDKTKAKGLSGEGNTDRPDQVNGQKVVAVKYNSQKSWAIVYDSHITDVAGRENPKPVIAGYDGLSLRVAGYFSRKPGAVKYDNLKAGIVQYDSKITTDENNDIKAVLPTGEKKAFYDVNMEQSDEVISKPAIDTAEEGFYTEGNDFVMGNKEYTLITYPNENSEPVAGSDSIAAPEKSEQGMDMFINKEALLNQIVERSVVNIQNGKTHITVKLKPRELGNVTVNIVSENGVTKASIFTDNMSVESVIQTQLSEIKDLLTEKGINLSELQVSYNANGSGDFHNRQFDGNTGRDARNGSIYQTNDIRVADQEAANSSLDYIRRAKMPGTINCLV